MITSRKEVADAPDTSEVGGCGGRRTRRGPGALFVMFIVMSALAFGPDVQTTVKKG